MSVLKCVMSNEFRAEDGVAAEQVTVSFGKRFQASEQFDIVFREGMALVERSAAYLDGEGRRASRGLPAQVTVLYATESMRLTTRLLELASWLLIRRAVKEGELTEEEAARKQARVKLQRLGRPSHIGGFDDLPDGLRDLIQSSFALYDRIVQLDRALTPKVDTGLSGAAVMNPVAAQVAKLEQAFGKES